MTVFKTFLKVLNKCKIPILLYTGFLVLFGALSMQTSDNNLSFVETKPDVLIINNDEEVGITKNLIDYIKKNVNINEIKNDEDAINDALFYRDVSYIIYIPKNYRTDVLNGNNPTIEVKSTGDYESSYTKMLLERYIKITNIYQKSNYSEEELINKINNSLTEKTNVEVTSKLDVNELAKATYFYNFANYSILAGCVYVICLVLSSFREEKIKKRTIISSMNYKKYNRILLLANGLFALTLWILYVVLSFIFVGDVIFTSQGLLYIINSFIFTICALTIAFLIGNLMTNKDAINGIINVIALGSSFLCGAFVPVSLLPEAVLNGAKILPSYWYIQNNEIIKNLEIINFETLKLYLLNISVIICFIIIFIIITNVISKKKV